MNLAFSRLEEGYENALKDYYKKQVRDCIRSRLSSPTASKPGSLRIFMNVTSILI